jgi:predicted MFS family arabinose efflux permease
MAVQAAWSVLAMSSPPLWSLAILLFLFFCGFNVLEASQPSLASRLAPLGSRGSALGVYNTLQSLGIFAGGAIGGLLIKNLGASGVFTASAALMLAWLGVAWGSRFVHKSPNGVASAH